MRRHLLLALSILSLAVTPVGCSDSHESEEGDGGGTDGGGGMDASTM